MKLNNGYLKGRLYLLPSLVLLLVPIVYSVFRWLDKGYWDSAIGNWLATMLGIIGGIPIGLEVNRLVTATEERKKTKIETEKERDILLLTKEELKFDLARLKERERNLSSLSLHPFKTDLWDAISDSGELKYIKIPALLNRITSAYHIIRIVKRIEEKCHEAMRSATVGFGNKTGHQLLLEDARSFDEQNLANIEYALKEVDNYFATKNP